MSGYRATRFVGSRDRMAIPPYDHMVNDYEGDRVVRVRYYMGGMKEQGNLVALIELEYNDNGNLLSVTRVQ